jgi:hypothetical protein
MPSGEARAIKLTNISSKVQHDPAYNVQIELRFAQILMQARNRKTSVHPLTSCLALQLHHRQVVTIYDVFVKEPTLCRVMELADQGDVLEFISQHQQYTELEASKLMHQVIVRSAEFIESFLTLDRTQERVWGWVGAGVICPLPCNSFLTASLFLLFSPHRSSVRLSTSTTLL